VQAILDGRKTQTRRVIEPQPKKIMYDGKVLLETEKHGTKFLSNYAQYAPYAVGDTLYVRETWRKISIGFDIFEHKADMHNDESVIPWKPPVSMPRAAARIFLRVADVQVERLQNISEVDARAEGIKSFWLHKEHGGEWHESNSPPFVGVGRDGDNMHRTRRDAFQQLWNSLNAKRDGGAYTWEMNPWVWVYEFERMTQHEKRI